MAVVSQISKMKKLLKYVTVLVTYPYLCICNEDHRNGDHQKYGQKYHEAAQQLWAWYEEVEEMQWNSPNDLKRLFGTASILTDKRVVFNIHGNKYRLIVDVEYKMKMVFIVWFGTHKEYDKMDSKKISYVKANKK